LETFQELLVVLEQQRDTCKSLAGSILAKAASNVFSKPNVSSATLWRSHAWSEGQAQGENGRSPSWELVVDCDPLWAPRGYYVHSLSVVDFENRWPPYSIPLLNVDKKRLNTDTFEKFWETARQLALKETVIIDFRKLWKEALEQSSNLEGRLEFEINNAS